MREIVVDFSYISWVLCRTKVANIAYFIVSLTVWLFTGAQGWLGTLASVLGLWAVLFWIHTKDPRTELQYHRHQQAAKKAGTGDA
jgi:hypothetical protein